MDGLNREKRQILARYTQELVVIINVLCFFFFSSVLHRDFEKLLKDLLD